MQPTTSKSLYVHIPACHSSSFPELELPTLLQPHHLKIHWFSIFNSCVTVLLLTGFLAIILMRVLKNDFVKYVHDEEAADDQEETGWKYIHGDLFRYPKYTSLFAASLGSGTQLFSLLCY